MQYRNRYTQFKAKIIPDRHGANNPNYGKKHPNRAKEIKEKYGEDIFKTWAKQNKSSGHYIRTNITKRKI